MKVLLLGSGGREHALGWKIAGSPTLSKLYAAPGNAGLAEIAECVPLEITDPAAVVTFCQNQAIDLVVVGPEAPLVAGVVDALLGAGIAAFGPTAVAAQLEGSKAFTKALCDEFDIPTARYAKFTNAASARAYVQNQGAPIVIKADGLAAGKGVTVAATINEALSAIDALADDHGALDVVIEECLTGPEASFFALVDGETVLPFGTAQDHKRAFDGDHGPNTGGMGAFSPAVVMDGATEKIVLDEIIRPTARGMMARGTPFQGVLYAGLMLTPEGPKLIEYNVRFGDPECQVLMMRLKSDLLETLHAAAIGELAKVIPEWHSDPALTVVLASKGYPGPYEKNTPINGLDTIAKTNDAQIFHAGTAIRNHQLVAVGGRVLNATAMGPTLKQAKEAAYSLCDQIRWPNGFYRTDIGAKAIERD